MTGSKALGMSPGVWHERNKFTFYRIRAAPTAGDGGGSEAGGTLTKCHIKHALTWEEARAQADREAGGLPTCDELRKAGVSAGDGVDLWMPVRRPDGRTGDYCQIGNHPINKTRYISHIDAYGMPGWYTNTSAAGWRPGPNSTSCKGFFYAMGNGAAASPTASGGTDSEATFFIDDWLTGIYYNGVDLTSQANKGQCSPTHLSFKYVPGAVLCIKGWDNQSGGAAGLFLHTKTPVGEFVLRPGDERCTVLAADGDKPPKGWEQTKFKDGKWQTPQRNSVWEGWHQHLPGEMRAKGVGGGDGVWNGKKKFNFFRIRLDGGGGQPGGGSGKAGGGGSDAWVGDIRTLDMARAHGRGGFKIHPVLAVTGRTVGGKEELVPGFFDPFNHVNHSLAYHKEMYKAVKGHALPKGETLGDEHAVGWMDASTPVHGHRSVAYTGPVHMGIAQNHDGNGNWIYGDIIDGVMWYVPCALPY